MASESPLADKKTRIAYNRALREKGVPAKACGSCFAVKALSQYHKHTSSPDGRRSYCRECGRAADAQWHRANADRKREYSRRYYAENAESRRAYRRKYHADNPERARAHWQRRRAHKAQATVEDFAPDDLLAAWEDAAIYSCYLCDLPFGDEDEVHLEHVIPLSGGGMHAVANILPAHDRCNRQKYAADPLDAWHRIQRETHGDAEAEARMYYVKAHTA